MKLCPGKIVRSLGPSDWMRASIAFRAPVPSAIIVITAPTPMMIPSAVSSERSLLTRIACSATRIVSSSSIAYLGAAGRAPPVEGCAVCCRIPGMPPPVKFWTRCWNCFWAFTNDADGSTSTVSPSDRPLTTSL